ncbi:MAG: hypothetical protein R2831_13035 [Chitinophagaceae bacterium]
MQSTITYLKQLRDNTKKNIWYILIISIIAFIITFILIGNIKGKYSTYSKIFPLSFNSSSNSAGAIEMLKAQFGISDKTDYEKIYNVKILVNSKTISDKIVSAKPNNSKYNHFYDWLLDDYNKNLTFYKKKLDFPKTDSIERNYAARNILLANTDVTSDENNFTSITTKFYDKDLTKQINDEILEQLSSYYLAISTEKPNSEILTLKRIKDSLKGELQGLEVNIANVQDKNILSTKYSTALPQARLSRSRGEVEQLYITTSTAYQNAKFKLLSQSPIFQVLDFPGAPFAFDKPSKFKFAIIAFVFAFFLFWIFFNRKIFLRMIIDELSKS